MFGFNLMSIKATSLFLKQATARSAPDREREIASLVRKAQFNNDPYVKEFNIKVFTLTYLVMLLLTEYSVSNNITR